MDKAGIDTWTQRSRALDLDGLAWDEIGQTPLAPEAVRTLLYMQDIESHTVVYVRQLLSTRVIDDPEVATFLACWFYEETFHGRALSRFLTAAGHAPIVRQRSQRNLISRLEERTMGALARRWPDFAAVHMVWGAINELTTLTGYQRLAELASHPVLADLLGRIIRDECRHFSFYYHQAERRLARPGVQRVARFLVDHFWAPVGSGVQPDAEVRFVAEYLLGGRDGRPAARKIDETIRRLPGFAGAALAEAWLDRLGCAEAQPIPNAPSSTSARRGHDRAQASLAMVCSTGAGSISVSAPSSADGRP